MSPAIDPMTFDELSELYRVEMKSASLTMTRKDLFRAMANLLTALRAEYEHQMSLDPDSVMTEGAGQRRKKADRLCKDIMATRTRKISVMAIRGAEGGRNELSSLTDEEVAYYTAVLDLTKRQLSEIDRLRGKMVTVETRIDELPVRDVRRMEPEPAAVVPAVQEPMPESMPDFPMDEPPLEEMFDDEPFDEPFDMQDGQPSIQVQPPIEVPRTEEPTTVPTLVKTVEPTVQEPVTTEDISLTPILIRVLEDLPEFAGPDRDYKLCKEDIVMLPKALADVLINTEKAMSIAPTP